VDSRLPTGSLTDFVVPKKDPIIIKKYKNRKLYNTNTGKYISFKDIIDLVNSEINFRIYSMVDESDITVSTVVRASATAKQNLVDTLISLKKLQKITGGNNE
jgi:polyhydroxyalkanoate synthesis regulator protein